MLESGNCRNLVLETESKRWSLDLQISSMLGIQEPSDRVNMGRNTSAFSRGVMQYSVLRDSKEGVECPMVCHVHRVLQTPALHPILHPFMLYRTKRSECLADSARFANVDVAAQASMLVRCRQVFEKAE